jgi:hypothetical protein
LKWSFEFIFIGELFPKLSGYFKENKEEEEGIANTG